MIPIETRNKGEPVVSLSRAYKRVFKARRNKESTCWK